LFNITDPTVRNEKEMMAASPEKTPLRYTLKLFITGRTSKSDLAISNLRRIFARMGYPLELTIIDILEAPQMAEEYRILATPTLLKTSPLPVQRIIGDLTDENKLFVGLGLTQADLI